MESRKAVSYTHLVLPGLDDVELPEDAEPAPQYLREGVRHEIVKKLQQRLMDLGFMDNDEPTDYFGQVTLTAVKHFQRQNELPQDGIVGNTTWDELMAEDAKHYACLLYTSEIRKKLPTAMQQITPFSETA